MASAVVLQLAVLVHAAERLESEGPDIIESDLGDVAKGSIALRDAG